jgi:hypothetical protein
MTRPRAETARKRVKIAQAVSILGLEARTVRDMASAGEIPGAAKPRGIWTFDAALLDQFNQEREIAACRSAAGGRKPQKAVSGGTACSTAGYRPGAATSNGHYEQTILKLRRAAARPSATAS